MPSFLIGSVSLTLDRGIARYSMKLPIDNPALVLHNRVMPDGLARRKGNRKMDIRFGSISEISNFPLFSEENQGGDVVIAESNGQIVGYMQINERADDATVYFVESTVKGTGTALLDWLKSRVSYIVADNVVESAVGFYSKMGFTKADFSNGYAGQICMEWSE